MNVDYFKPNQIKNERTHIYHKSLEGGYGAKAVGESIFTEADTIKELRENVKEATKCHFEEGELPDMTRLHY